VAGPVLPAAVVLDRDGIEQDARPDRRDDEAEDRQPGIAPQAPGRGGGAWVKKKGEAR